MDNRRLYNLSYYVIHSWLIDSPEMNRAKAIMSICENLGVKTHVAIAILDTLQAQITIENTGKRHVRMSVIREIVIREFSVRYPVLVQRVKVY